MVRIWLEQNLAVVLDQVSTLFDDIFLFGLFSLIDPVEPALMTTYLKAVQSRRLSHY